MESSGMEFWLPAIWSVVIAVGVLMYVVMDGFDLGIGLLFPFARGERERDVMMNSVAPVWDGNETWLVLGGGGLLAAFPVAYATILPALYLPIILMLMGLIFRGVAFEFRAKASDANKYWWNTAFAGGSALATLTQGIALGAFIQGFQVEITSQGAGDLTTAVFAGSAFAWLTPFSIVCGLALMLGYGLLGATWLIMKTDGELQDWAYERAEYLLGGVVLALIVVSIWTPLLDPMIRDTWFSWPNILMLSPVPIITALILLQLWRSLQQRREVQPFGLAIVTFLLSYLGLGISLYPYVVPHEISVWQGASAQSSLIFMLVGVVILLPVILAYTGYCYWVFRGKVRPEEGYH